MSGKKAKSLRREINKFSNIKKVQSVDKSFIELKLPPIEKRKDIINNIFKNGILEVYHQIDSIIAANAPFLNFSCKKGCDYCCYGPVEIYHIEAKYISDNLNNIKIKENCKIFDREKYQREVFYEGNYFRKCPFLKNHECSIYNFRPFICRIFNSLSDSSICKKAYEDSIKNNKYLGNLIRGEYKINALGIFEESEGKDNNGNNLLDFGNEFINAMHVMITVLNDTQYRNREGSKGDIRDYFDDI